MKKTLSQMTKSDWNEYVQDTVALVLPKELDTTEYANGSGYIQLSIATHAKFLLRYRDMVEATVPNLLHHFDSNPSGFIGRYLDDMHSPAYILWGRMACIDGKLRMWGQPYFVRNPPDKLVCLANV